MRISDAKPGDVLRDIVGDLWLVAEDGAWFLTERGFPIVIAESLPFDYTRDAIALGFADDDHGPFARLVPEPQTVTVVVGSEDVGRVRP